MPLVALTSFRLRSTSSLSWKLFDKISLPCNGSTGHWRVKWSVELNTLTINWQRSPCNWASPHSDCGFVRCNPMVSRFGLRPRCHSRTWLFSRVVESLFIHVVSRITWPHVRLFPPSTQWNKQSVTATTKLIIQSEIPTINISCLEYPCCSWTGYMLLKGLGKEKDLVCWIDGRNSSTSIDDTKLLLEPILLNFFEVSLSRRAGVTQKQDGNELHQVENPVE